MDRNLWILVLILGFVFTFGGLQGLYNLSVGVVFFTGLVVLIMITFFKKDLIIAGLKFLFYRIFRKRRW